MSGEAEDRDRRIQIDARREGEPERSTEDVDEISCGHGRSVRRRPSDLPRSAAEADHDADYQTDGRANASADQLAADQPTRGIPDPLGYLHNRLDLRARRKATGRC